MADNELEKAILDNHLVFGLIDLGPVFFIDGRVYYCLQSSDPNTNNFLIKEGPRIEVLEKISDEILKPSCERFKKGFLEETVKNVYDKSSESSDKIANFVLNEVFPYLRQDFDALRALLEIKPEDKKQETSDNLDEMTRKYIDEKRDLFRKQIYRLEKQENVSISPKFNSKVLELSNNCNLAIFNEQVFLLREEGTEKSRVSIGSKNYSFVKSMNLGDFKKHFVNNSLLDLRINALEEEMADSSAYSRLKENIYKLNHANSSDNYDEGSFGFIRKSNSLYVYVNVPEHVLKAPFSNDYFRFDSHKVGIDMGMDRNYPYLLRQPHTIENVEGPFYRLGEHDLCMGNYSFSYIDSYRDKGKAFAKLLTDARNVTLRGYGNYGGTPHRSLSRDNFSHRIISYEDAKKIGITNINAQERKW